MSKRVASTIQLRHKISDAANLKITVGFSGGMHLNAAAQA
jgi:hypothetical protein